MTTPPTGRTLSLVGHTESMTARTTPATDIPRGLSRAAQAAWSLAAVRRLPEGSPERSEAFGAHLSEYGTRPRSTSGTCRIR